MRQQLLAGLLTLACVGLSSIEAQGGSRPGDIGSVRFRLGYLTPQGDSQYWDDKAVDFTGSAGDLKDLSFGFDYLWRLSPNSGLLFSTTFFSGRTVQAYREYADDAGFDISHTTTLETFDMTAAWLFQPGGRRPPIAPYFALGGGFTNWTLNESGSFIDFGDPDWPIVYASYYDSSSTLMAFALAGLEIPVNYAWSVLAEARWKYAEDTLARDFAGFGDIDLSGWEVSLGFAFNY